MRGQRSGIGGRPPFQVSGAKSAVPFIAKRFAGAGKHGASQCYSSESALVAEGRTAAASPANQYYKAAWSPGKWRLLRLPNKMMAVRQETASQAARLGFDRFYCLQV